MRQISSSVKLRFRIRANNKTCDEINRHCGVCQRTFLGPLLFLIMANGDNILHVKMYKYVDVMTLVFAHKPGRYFFVNTKKCRETISKYYTFADRDSPLTTGDELLTRATEVKVSSDQCRPKVVWQYQEIDAEESFSC